VVNHAVGKQRAVYLPLISATLEAERKLMMVVKQVKSVRNSKPGAAQCGKFMGCHEADQYTSRVKVRDYRDEKTTST
jgi:hypothetical protein